MNLSCERFFCIYKLLQTIMVEATDWSHECPVDGKVYAFRLPPIPLVVHRLCQQYINAARTTDSFGTPIKPVEPVNQKQIGAINNVGK